jgi:hypothetical protein
MPFPDLKSVPEASTSREQVSNHHGRASTQTLLLYIKTWGQKTQCSLGKFGKPPQSTISRSEWIWHNFPGTGEITCNLATMKWRDFLVRKSVPWFVLMHLNSSIHCGLEFYVGESTTVTSFSHDTQLVSWEKKNSSGDLQRVIPLEWAIYVFTSGRAIVTVQIHSTVHDT